MPTYHLVDISGVKHCMVDAYGEFTNRMCNSMIFKNKDHANLDVCVFEHFNKKVTVLEKLDLRTKRAKELIDAHGWFSVLDLTDKG